MVSYNSFTHVAGHLLANDLSNCLSLRFCSTLLKPLTFVKMKNGRTNATAQNNEAMGLTQTKECYKQTNISTQICLKQLAFASFMHKLNWIKCEGFVSSAKGISSCYYVQTVFNCLKCWCNPKKVHTFSCCLFKFTKKDVPTLSVSSYWIPLKMEGPLVESWAPGNIIPEGS